MRALEEEREHLHGLAEAHVVRETRPESARGEAREPFVAVALVRTQLGLQTRRRLHLFCKRCPDGVRARRHRRGKRHRPVAVGEGAVEHRDGGGRHLESLALQPPGGIKRLQALRERGGEAEVFAVAERHELALAVAERRDELRDREHPPRIQSELAAHGEPEIDAARRGELPRARLRRGDRDLPSLAPFKAHGVTEVLQRGERLQRVDERVDAPRAVAVRPRLEFGERLPHAPRRRLLRREVAHQDGGRAVVRHEALRLSRARNEQQVGVRERLRVEREREDLVLPLDAHQRHGVTGDAYQVRPATDGGQLALDRRERAHAREKRTHRLHAFLRDLDRARAAKRLEHLHRRERGLGEGVVMEFVNCPCHAQGVGLRHADAPRRDGDRKPAGRG